MDHVSVSLVIPDSHCPTITEITIKIKQKVNKLIGSIYKLVISDVIAYSTEQGLNSETSEFGRSHSYDGAHRAGVVRRCIAQRTLVSRNQALVRERPLEQLIRHVPKLHG